MERRDILKDFEGFIKSYATRDFIYFYFKNFDYPEKPLKYKHIRRISD